MIRTVVSFVSCLNSNIYANSDVRLIIQNFELYVDNKNPFTQLLNVLSLSSFLLPTFSAIFKLSTYIKKNKEGEHLPQRA